MCKGPVVMGLNKGQNGWRTETREYGENEAGQWAD